MLCRLNAELVKSRPGFVQARVQNVIPDDTGISIYNYHENPFPAFRVHLVDPQDVRLVGACYHTLLCGERGRGHAGN
jgi:hypothetical protein